MKKKYSIILAILFFCIPIFGQQKTTDVIYLKNGDKYTGKIVFKNEEVIMLETNDGKRFQFQTSEIKETTQEEATSNESQTQTYNKGNLVGLLQLDGGTSAIKGGIKTSPMVDLSLAFGSKKVLGKNMFLGVGGGFENIFDSSNKRSISFLPIFAQMKNTFSERNNSPALNLKLGYAFPLQQDYRGGLYFYTSGGINLKNTESSNIYLGLYVKIQSTSGKISETFQQDTFTSVSNAVITSIGVSTAITF